MCKRNDLGTDDFQSIPCKEEMQFVPDSNQITEFVIT